MGAKGAIEKKGTRVKEVWMMGVFAESQTLMHSHSSVMYTEFEIWTDPAVCSAIGQQQKQTSGIKSQLSHWTAQK